MVFCYAILGCSLGSLATRRARWKGIFPDGSGHFNLQNYALNGGVLHVEGPTTTSVSTSAQSTSIGSSSAYSSSPHPPAFRSVLTKSGNRGQSMSVTSVKIIRAFMNSSRTGKPEFTQEELMHIDVVESTANVQHITREVQERWGKNYVIDTTDGLELKDCDGTRSSTYNSMYSLNYRPEILEITTTQVVCHHQV